MALSLATIGDLARLTARVHDTANRSSGCRLDAYRIDDTFFVDIDLPGVDPVGIDIGVEGKVLTVRAQRKHTEQQAEKGEPAAATSPVSRQMFLSDTLDTDRLEARYDNGVLTLRIPVSATADPARLDTAA